MSGHVFDHDTSPSYPSFESGVPIEHMIYFVSGEKNYPDPSLGKQWRAVGFDYFSFELVLTLNLQERYFRSTGIF